MDKETTLKLLYKFVDYSRRNMDKPFSQELSIGKYVCSTNAKFVLLIPETEENKIENIEGYLPPNINGILPEFKEEIAIDFSQIIKLYNDVPIIDRQVTDDCESCDGAGTFTHYGHSYECKECDETGQVQTFLSEKVKNPYTVFRFNEIDLNIKNIVSLIEIFTISKSKTFSITFIRANVIWFKMDDMYICTTGEYDISDSQYYWDVVKVNFENN